MSCEEERKRVHELKVESAKEHQAYSVLVGPPEVMKVLPTTPEESRALKEARERCNKVDEALSAAILAELECESTR